MNIATTISVAVPKGPTINAQQTIEVEGYDKVELSVPKKADGGKIVATVQPGGAGAVRLLVVTADPAGPDVKYGWGDPPKDATLPLDGPQVVVGAGLADKLGPMKQIMVTNDTDKPVAVEVLVVRRAVDGTPPPGQGQGQAQA